MSKEERLARSRDYRRLSRALYRLEHPLSPRSINKIKKLCLYCGGEFWVFPSLNSVQCCSRKCARALEQPLRLGVPLKPSIRECLDCKIVLKIEGDGRCSECLRRHRASESLKKYHADMRIESRRNNKRETAMRYYRNVQCDPIRKKHRNLVMRECESRRRAREKSTRIGRVSYKRILDTFGMVCSICGGEIVEGSLSFDHVIPLVRGGSHTENNIRPAHLCCNRRKNRKLPTEAVWLT